MLLLYLIRWIFCILLYTFYFVFLVESLTRCCDCAKESMFYILFYATFARIYFALLHLSSFTMRENSFVFLFYFTFLFSFLLCSLIHFNLDLFYKNRIELNSDLLIFFLSLFEMFSSSNQFMKIQFFMNLKWNACFNEKNILASLWFFSYFEICWLKRLSDYMKIDRN